MLKILQMQVYKFTEKSGDHLNKAFIISKVYFEDNFAWVNYYNSYMFKV